MEPGPLVLPPFSGRARTRGDACSPRTFAVESRTTRSFRISFAHLPEDIQEQARGLTAFFARARPSRSRESVTYGARSPKFPRNFLPVSSQRCEDCLDKAASSLGQQQCIVQRPMHDGPGQVY